MRLIGQQSVLAAKQVAQLTSAGCRCLSLPAGGCLLYQIEVPYCFMFLVWQISFHRDSKGQVLLDIAFKEHPGFNPLAAGGRSLEHLLEAWNLNQERQLYQVLEQVFLRQALASDSAHDAHRSTPFLHLHISCIGRYALAAISSMPDIISRCSRSEVASAHPQEPP